MRYFDELVTWKSFLAITMADIDIFLLQEEDQETDKDKLYTKEEIRLQLENTLAKMLRVLMASGVDIDKVLPLKD